MLVGQQALSVKFTEHGSVTLRVESQDHWLILQVKDTGIGMSPEVQPHLFQPFVQGDGTSTRCIGGTGQGSTFEIHLPLFGAQYIDRLFATIRDTSHDLPRQLRELAHNTKGMAANLLVNDLRWLASHIEALCRTQPEAALSATDSLASAVEAMISSLGLD